mmetsp:Transcript_29773/g.72548  ORF Transcript_29773/g.72548 Transcript_29773/m.72548 type:complete len:89 (-) Transcript_29773:829-1095(-)
MSNTGIRSWLFHSMLHDLACVHSVYDAKDPKRIDLSASQRKEWILAIFSRLPNSPNTSIRSPLLLECLRFCWFLVLGKGEPTTTHSDL